MMANALIAPWFIEQVRAKIAERTGHSLSQTVATPPTIEQVSQ